MDIRQLKYFITVVEEKTVTAAAVKLHMTQPPLSQQLHQLERELGCRLFRQEGRRLSLTDAGRRLYSRALEICGMCERAQEEMAEYRRGAVGTLKVGVISSVQGPVFSGWMQAYHALYPEVRLSVYSANTYQLLEKLRNRETDIAITRTPFSAEELEVRSLWEEPIHAVGAAGFFPEGAGELSLEALSSLPLILYRRWQKIVESRFEAAGVVPHILCVNDDARMTLSLSLAGIGVGLLHPSAFLRELPEGIRACPVADAALSSRIALVFRAGERLPEPAAFFCRLAEETGNPLDPLRPACLRPQNG